jgi:hypothetical protein
MKRHDHSLSENTAAKKSNEKPQSNNYLFYRGAIPLLFMFLVIIGLGAMYVLNTNRINGDNGSKVKIFSDGQILYLTDNRKLYSYDSISKDIKLVIDEPVYEFYANDKYYFYYSRTGFYYQDIATKEKYRIADNAFEIIEHQGAIYFVEYKDEDIYNPLDERNLIGQKKWVTLYQFTIADETLTKIKSEYHHDDYLTHKIKDISITDLFILNDGLFYRNASGISYLSLDGALDTRIYQSDGRIGHLDWFGDKFYCIEHIEWNPADPMEVKIDEGLFFTIISLNGGEISSCRLPDEHYSIYEEMVFDPKSNVYWSMLGEHLVTFSPANPTDFTPVAKIERTTEQNLFELIMVGSSIYIAAYDGTAHRNNDFCIMNVSDQNEVITIITNGKAVR